MKKIITLGLGALLASTAAFAQTDEPYINVLPGGVYYGGFMPQNISANGQYVCGSTYLALFPFTSAWQQDNTYVYLDGLSVGDYGGEAVAVTPEGKALGFDDLGNFWLDCNTHEVTRIDLNDSGDPEKPIRDAIPDAMTEDGSIIVGECKYVGNSLQRPCYWENGIFHELPMPTEEEFGVYHLGARARFVSTDGSRIFGYVIDRFSTLPLIYWERQEDGTYKLNHTYQKYWWDSKYHRTRKDYQRFRPDAVSKNGKTVILTVVPTSNTEAILDFNLTAYYDVDTDELTIVNINGEHGIAPFTKLDVYFNGVSDDGTVVGSCIDATYTTYTAFIMYGADKQPRLMTEVFDNIGELFDYQDGYPGEGGENKVSAITPDGKYVTGTAWWVDAQLDRGLYEGWVLYTGDKNVLNTEQNGVEAIAPADNAAPEYYTISGQKLNAPVKGINIVRYPDGTSKKVVL